MLKWLGLFMIRLSCIHMCFFSIGCELNRFNAIVQSHVKLAIFSKCTKTRFLLICSYTSFRSIHFYVMRTMHTYLQQAIFGIVKTNIAFFVVVVFSFAFSRVSQDKCRKLSSATQKRNRTPVAHLTMNKWISEICYSSFILNTRLMFVPFVYLYILEPLVFVFFLIVIIVRLFPVHKQLCLEINIFAKQT